MPHRKPFILLQVSRPLAELQNCFCTKLQKKMSRKCVTFMCLGKKRKMRKQMKGCLSTVWSQNSSFHSRLRLWRKRGRAPPPSKCTRWCQMSKKVSHLYRRGRPICVDALFSSMYATFLTLLHLMPQLSWRTKKTCKKKNKTPPECRWLWMLHQLLAHFPASNLLTRRSRNNQHSAWFSLFHPPELYFCSFPVNQNA